MIRLGHDDAGHQQLMALLLAPHRIRTRVRLLDLDHNYIDDLSDVFAGGSVTIDTTQEITRALDISFLDPYKAIHMDPNSPARTAVYITNMISVVVNIMSPDRTQSFDIPVFCGPVSKVDRDSVFINVKCVGKESLSILNLWLGRGYKKNQAKTDVIRSILRTLCGETKMSLIDKAEKLPNNLDMEHAPKPWKVVKRLCGSMGYQIFYDGRGTARMRKTSVRRVFTFRNNALTTPPSVGYDLQNVINAVRVIGGTPKKSKKKIHVPVVADRAHPLSPWRQGRGGVPRYLWTEIQDDKIRTTKDARARGKRRLQEGLLEGVEAAFDGLPIYNLEELDVLGIQTDNLATEFKLKKVTLPLTADANASYGYLRAQRPRGSHKIIKVHRFPKPWHIPPPPKKKTDKSTKHNAKRGSKTHAKRR